MNAIEEKCKLKGVRLTDQRKIIAQVMSDSKEKYGSKNEEFVSAAFEDIDFLDARDLLYEDVDTALAKKAKETGYPKGLLRQIYNRGSAAFKGGHRPGQNQHSWSFARVNSVIAGGPARKSDSDIWAKMQAAKKRKKKGKNSGPPKKKSSKQ